MVLLDSGRLWCDLTRCKTLNWVFSRHWQTTSVWAIRTWINQRLKSIEIRKDLTDEWKRRGLEEGVQFATLTDIIYHTWAGMTAREYKKFKGLKKENLRDNMTNRELVMNMYNRCNGNNSLTNKR